MTETFPATEVAGLCPCCGATDLVRWELSGGIPIEGCRACGAAWEAETRGCSGSEPCNNCAFRPNSPEKADPYAWAQLIESLEETGRPFWCHKRVPIELNGTGYRFLHEYNENKTRPTNAPVCAGWIAWRLGQLSKARAKQ